MRFPDFFLVGASKAGTTAICDTLAKHPDICFSEVKEPNFFSGFDTSLEAIPDDELLKYQKLFAAKRQKQQLGEGSVKYLGSINANYWIKRYVPAAKIVIILRNPIQRVVSLYEMYTRLGKIQMSQEEAFAPDSFIVGQCCLYQKVLLYINSFSQDQVLVMTFDDFLRDQAQSFHHLCEFIGVQKTPDMLLSARNKGGIPRSNAFSIFKNRALIDVTKKILPSSRHAQIDNFVKSTFFKKASLQPSQEAELLKVFAKDAERTGILIGRDICSEWQLDRDYTAKAVVT